MLLILVFLLFLAAILFCVVLDPMLLLCHKLLWVGLSLGLICTVFLGMILIVQ